MQPLDYRLGFVENTSPVFVGCADRESLALKNGDELGFCTGPTPLIWTAV